MTEAAPGAFPVTTALDLTGMTVERDLGVALGGNAVIALRFASSQMGQQLTETVAYCTTAVDRPAR
jgi:hypothetical protein